MITKEANNIDCLVRKAHVKVWDITYDPSLDTASLRYILTQFHKTPFCLLC